MPPGILSTPGVFKAAPAVPSYSPLNIGPGAVVPHSDTQDWDITGGYVQNRTTLTLQQFYAPVVLPLGATVTKLTLYGFRDDAASVLNIKLQHHDRAGTSVLMAQVTADWAGGEGNGEDVTITDPVIDNVNRDYHLIINITPNDAVLDCYFRCAVVEWI